MLGNTPFYFGSVRKIVYAFGALFSDIHIVRVDQNNDANTQTLKVPLAYGPKEKWVYRTKQDVLPGVTDPVDVVLPRMSYEITGYQYDNARKLHSIGRTVALSGSSGTLQSQFNPVPYNISFDLNIGVKSTSDGLMIVEQILPFFTPDYTISIKDMPQLNLLKDIPVVLNGFRSEDNWAADFNSIRFITYTLSFTAKAYIYPPIQTPKIVLSSQINFDIDGETSVSGTLPTFLTTPVPSDATAATVTGFEVTETENAVVIQVTPSSVILSSSHSASFSVTVLNTDTLTYTVTGAASQDTVVISGASFTYTAGTRTQTQILTITVTSVVDTTRSTLVVLTLNP